MAFTEQEKKNLMIGIFLALLILVVSGYLNFVIFKQANSRDLEQKQKVKKQITELNLKLGKIIGMVDREDEIKEMSDFVLSVSERLPSDPEETAFLYQLNRRLRTIPCAGSVHEHGRDQPPTIYENKRV